MNHLYPLFRSLVVFFHYLLFHIVRLLLRKQIFLQHHIMYCSTITMGTEKHSVEDKPQKKNRMRVREKKERIKTEINNKKNVSNCTQTICPQVLESELVTDAKGPPFVIVFRQFKDVHDFHGIHELVTWIMNYILNSHCTVSDGRIDTSYRRTTFFFTASNITPTL